MAKSFRRNFDPLIGSTVTSEIAFGIAPAVGSSGSAAREDHTHGTPADPVPAHSTAATGVHGVGGSTVESIAGSQAKVDAHKDAATGVHGVGGSTVESIAGSQAKVDAHVALGDPHTQYILDTEKAAANGICPLDSGSLVPLANIPAALTGKTADLLNLSYVSAENGGAVTITSADTSIVTLDLGTVTTGQIFFIDGGIQNGAKGATAGMLELYLGLSTGSAAIKFLNSLATRRVSSYLVANIGYCSLLVSGLMVITGSGTLVIKLVGTSVGSDTTLAAGEGQIAATRIK